MTSSSVLPRATHVAESVLPYIGIPTKARKPAPQSQGSFAWHLQSGLCAGIPLIPAGTPTCSMMEAEPTSFWLNQRPRSFHAWSNELPTSEAAGTTRISSSSQVWIVLAPPRFLFLAQEQTSSSSQPTDCACKKAIYLLHCLALSLVVVDIDRH